ncbi:MAG: NfeD family protein [Oscillospiraceae bacterium]
MGSFGALIWLILAAGLIIVESMTVQLVCIWFAVGSLLAAMASYVGAAFWLQLLICLLSSLAVLIVGRPLLLDKLTVRRQATNADQVVGQLGMVTQRIDNLQQTGRVSANGLDWSARSEGGQAIPQGMPVEVLRIDGVKLIVRPVNPFPPEEEKAAQEMQAPPASQGTTSQLYTAPDMPAPPALDTDISLHREE